MNKKKAVITSIIIFVAGILIFWVIRVGLKFYQNMRIKNATVIVDLKDDLEVLFNTDNVVVSSFISNINGKIVDDFVIDTTKIGEQEIRFEYINDEKIRIPYSFKIVIVDKVAPIVWLSNSYSVNVGFDGNLADKILCADDYDDEPKCEIVGEYNTEEAGDYNLNFVAEDSSGNKKSIPFTLHVVESKHVKPSKNPPSINYLDFNDMKEKFNEDFMSLGIDVSTWQGDIDFDAVKDAGVEFVFIRVGSKKTSTREYFVDSKFKQNLEGFKRVGIPVGVYFYTYAKDEEEAIEDAKWVLEQLDGIDLELPIAYDFEDWSRYNAYKMSLYRLNKNALSFIRTVEDAGYKGILYSSLNYLNNLWDTDGLNIWVAHYNTNADYKDKYKFWQYSASGRVPGINGQVDLDIMYK